jgi:hypothetical protein
MSFTKVCVMIPGLNDGLISVPYFATAARKLIRLGYVVVQPVFRSSWGGFGMHTLDDDVDDLHQVREYEAAHAG